MLVEIYCGKCWEAFSPPTLATTGHGGSETAVIEMARSWAKQGHRVRVWGEVEGKWEGVQYLHYSRFNPNLMYDVLIGWRNWGLFEIPIQARKRVLWLHDLGLPTLSPAASENITHIAVLSQFHGKSVLQTNPHLESKIWSVGNGIDLARYQKVATVEKDRHAFIYSSSPRRGLSQLLTEWPEVRKSHPEATLYVAYGFDLTITMETQAGNHYAARAYRRMLEKCQSTEGVQYMGRLSQTALAELQMKCAAWLYPPSDFEETYCITAVEIQAARCIPYTRENGALPEVLKDYYPWEPDMSTQHVVAMHYTQFYDSKFTKSMLDDNYAHAMTKSWDEQAGRWMLEFAK